MDSVAAELAKTLGSPVSKILNGAFELGDDHPAKYFLARCVLRALADFVGYMADDDLRADRLRVAELFVVLPQFTRQWGYQAEVPAWWPMPDRGERIETIEYNSRVAVRQRMAAILKTG